MRDTTAIKAIILPTIESLGYELWGCVCLLQGRRRILRVYIDQKSKRITLADCERVSRHIAAVLDVGDLPLNTYNLEVSSPGLDRLLFTEEHFRRFVGYFVAVHIRAPMDGQRRFKGLLKSTNKEGIVINQEEKECLLTWDNIVRANLLPEINK